MDENCPKRHLHEESNSSSDGESSLIPRKQPNCRKSTEYSVPNPSTEVDSTTPEKCDLSYDASDSSSDTDCLPRHRKDQNFPRKTHGYSTVDPSPEESATVAKEYQDSETQKMSSENAAVRKTVICSLKKPTTAVSEIENMDENVHEYDKKTSFTSNPPEKESIDSLEGMKASTNASSTSETQDDALDWYVVSGTEVESTEDLAAKALKLEYMNKYANEYSKELLFAVDLMTLVRYLNHLECKYIIYATSGNPPISPCNDTLDQALAKKWKFLMTHHGHIFESQLENKVYSYFRFQDIVLTLAEREESQDFNEGSFITYCLLVAQCAVVSERNGILDAPEFIPLLICRTIQNFKDSARLPSDFWEMIAEKALDILIDD